MKFFSSVVFSRAFFGIAGLVLACATPQKSRPSSADSEQPASEESQQWSLSHWLDTNPAWQESPEREFMALVEDFIGLDYEISVQELSWEPGSLSGRGLLLQATTPGRLIQRLQFQKFSVGETETGLEFDGETDGGTVQLEMVESLVAKTIAVSASLSEMPAPTAVGLSLGGYGLAGNLTIDISLVLLEVDQATLNAHSWQWGDIDLDAVSKDSQLSIVRPTQDAPISLGATFISARWDASKRRAKMSGGFQGKTRQTSLTSVSATYSPEKSEFLLDGRIDRSSPTAGFTLSGSTANPVLTPDVHNP